jgi:peroxiredoxin
MIQEGERTPAFELESDSGDTVPKTDLERKRVVIYRYPKANGGGRE